jgi:hypothetical protein
VLTDGTQRIPTDYSVWFHTFGDYGGCRNDCPVADRDAPENSRSKSEPDTRTDPDRRVCDRIVVAFPVLPDSTPIGNSLVMVNRMGVVVENLDPVSEKCPVADFDAIAAADDAVVPDVHLLADHDGTVAKRLSSDESSADAVASQLDAVRGARIKAPRRRSEPAALGENAVTAELSVRSGSPQPRRKASVTCLHQTSGRRSPVDRAAGKSMIPIYWHYDP